ncbi:F0F1 ATP synthase subunit A [Alteromonas gracilis]
MSLIPMVLASAAEYVPPGPADFEIPPFLGPITKPMVLLVLAAVMVFAFFRAASAKGAMVPGRLQFVGEAGYGFIRNTLGRDVIGSRDFMRFVPLLFTLFFFILVNNSFALIPLLQFPTMSRIGYPMGLALIVWVVYNYAGARRHGALQYLKLQTVPSGVPPWLLPLLVPMEFFSNIVVRPLTLMLRLFANMFAGHLLLILFALGAEFLLLEVGGLFASVGGVAALVMFVVISFLEMLVLTLQAFVFTILTSLYISLALADEH